MREEPDWWPEGWTRDQAQASKGLTGMWPVNSRYLEWRKEYFLEAAETDEYLPRLVLIEPDPNGHAPEAD